MMQHPIGEAWVERWLDKEHNVLLANGDFAPLFQGYIDHARRWDRIPDPLGAIMMRQGLAAASLYLSCRPRDENVGWTFSFQAPAQNFFFTGDAGTSRVTGRVFTEGVKPANSDRLYVQSNRTATGSSQSCIDVEGLDLLRIFEEYYTRSEQHPARFFDYDDGRFAMALGLPDCDGDWLERLDRESMLGHLDRIDYQLDTRQFIFCCGCNPERIVEVVRTIYEEDPEWLFSGEDEVEVQCPRCSRVWSVARADL